MEGLDLSAALQAIYSAVNVPAMLALAIIAFVLHRVGAVTARAAQLIPLGVGCVLGVLSALGHAQVAQGGWLTTAQLAEAIIIGALLNGGGALLIGRGASVLLDKMGLWPTVPADVPPPPPDA